jgi:hypothetical protein
MFAAGSIKSSKWGWSLKTYPAKYGDTESTQGSTVGYFTGGCLAPNGFIYCLPTYKGAQFVTVIKPGKSNSKTGKWEPATITNVPTENTANSKKPLLPDITSVSGSEQRRFANRGILAPNGLIYFFGFFTNGYVVVKPQENPNTSITAGTEWKVVTYASVELEPVANGSGYGGGFLHTDGKIYLLPQYMGTIGANAPIVRIIPRSDYQIADTIQKSTYWTPTGIPNDPRKYFGAGVISAGSFPKPADINGVAITVPTDTHAPFFISTNSGIRSMPAIGDAISHPNGNIYIFGGARNAYVLKVKTDDTTWNSNSLPVGAMFYTSNSLRVPNKLPAGYAGELGLQGCFMSGSIEKLKPGQDPSTAKIYLHYTGTTANDPSITLTIIENAYTRTILFDPVTETFENIGEQITSKVDPTAPWSIKPPVKMANGHTFNASVPYITGGSAVANKNLYGQLIVSGEISNIPNKIIGPTLTRSLLNATQNNKLASCYALDSLINPVTNQGSHALTGSSLGKTFVTSPAAAFEITSVKGFYPGIKYFNYKGNTGANFTSKLKTHTGLVILSANQVKLLGVDLVSSLVIGSKFVLSGTNTGNDGSYTISARSLSGSDTIVTVTGNPFSPAYQDTIQGINVTSATTFEFNCTYDQSQVIFNNDIIYIEGTDNDDYYVINGVSITFLYSAGPPSKGTITSSTPIFTPGNFTNGLVYYDNPLVESTAVFTYGQLVEFPNSETLRIYGVDLTNSMYQVEYVNIQGSSASGNNGAQQIYNPNNPPIYENGYTDIIFQGVSFTQLAPEAGVTMSYQYTFNDSDIYDIPDDLSELPTSLYNSYFNKPR